MSAGTQASAVLTQDHARARRRRQMAMRRSLLSSGLFAMLVACGGEVPSSPTDSICVWNHAYQENTQADSVEAILAGAQDCYVLIDPFSDPAAVEAISTMQEAGNTVGCYISVGTCEDWRDDFDAIRDHCTDQVWPEWPGEFFVSNPDGVVPVMQARIDQLAAWGCDMVEFDNMDWASDPEHNARYGLAVTPEGAIAYYQGLCDHVHASGMKCMAKSTREGGEDFDGGTFESFPAHDRRRLPGAVGRGRGLRPGCAAEVHRLRGRRGWAPGRSTRPPAHHHRRHRPGDPSGARSGSRVRRGAALGPGRRRLRPEKRRPGLGHGGRGAVGASVSTVTGFVC